MYKEFYSAESIMATSSYSSITSSEGGVTRGMTTAKPSTLQNVYLDTSIAVADHVAVSRSAESMGVVLDQPRPSRARTLRLGTPSPGRRGGAMAGSPNRYAPTGASAQVKNVLSRKSKSCTVQCERLRLDYTFEKPNCSDEVFPSMFEELLRSFEEEDNPDIDTMADVDEELALIMSGMLSDQDDEDLVLPGKLLYRIFAGNTMLRSPRVHSNEGKEPPPSAGEIGYLNLAPETPKISECDRVATSSFLSSTENELPVRPQPPSPPENGTSAIISETKIQPSTSANLNSSETEDAPKQIYVAYESNGAPSHPEVKQSCNLAPMEIKSDSKSEEMLKSTPSSIGFEEEKEHADKEKNLQDKQLSKFETAKASKKPEPFSNTALLSFGGFSDAHKGQSESRSCEEIMGDMLTETVLEKIKNDAAASDRPSPPFITKPCNDRIRSDKRIPLPEEILLAINRAIELGEFQAQGDSDTLMTCPSGRRSNIGTVVESRQPARANTFPSKSSKFPNGEYTAFRAQQPFSYFKISSPHSVNNVRDEKPEEANDGVEAETDNSKSHEPVLLTTGRSVCSGPLYRKSCDKSKKRRIIAATEWESVYELLATPPNTPTRSKTGITFSDPIAVCVTDCNTNMAGSGSSFNIACSENPAPKSEEINQQNLHGKLITDEVGDSVRTDDVKAPACPTTGGGFGDKISSATKLDEEDEISCETKPASPTRRPRQYLTPKTTLNSHPSILLKPREYLNFYAFLRNKKPVTKEVRKPKTKIFKLQRMMTDLAHEMGTRSITPDPEESEIGSKPIFPRGREVPPGWKPGEHGSHPITQISAEYGLAAQSSTKTKKHAWKKSKVRRRGSRRRDNRAFVKQSASDTSDIASPQMRARKKSYRVVQDSSDDMAVLTNSEFEQKRQFYEHEQRFKSSSEGYVVKPGRRNRPKKVTEQVKFLKTIDDIYNAEDDDYCEDDSFLPLEGYDESWFRYNKTECDFNSSLAKYYINKLGKSITREDSAESDSSLAIRAGVRIGRANLQVPSAMSHERLRAICSTSPLGASSQVSRFPRHIHHWHANLPSTSAKWPEGSLDTTSAQLSKKNPRKPHKDDSEWLSSSKIGVNSDYRAAWEQLRANFVEAKNDQPHSSSDNISEQVKKGAREVSKRSPAKFEKNSSPKKTPAAKLIAGLNEKSKSFKLKQLAKFPAPSDRSEEDTWCYSVNAMLLKSKQVMADGQKKGTHRFPRHNSAAVVSPVIDQKATSSFLKTLLSQDAEELRLSKMAAAPKGEAGIRQQRDRIRNAVNKTATGKHFSTGKHENKSCNAGSLTPTGEYECLVSLAEHSSLNAKQSKLPAGRIHKPVNGRLPGNRHKKNSQDVKSSPRKPLRRTIQGSSYIVDQTLHYYEYPFITKNSIVPLFDNTNSNALPNDELTNDSLILEEQISHISGNVNNCYSRRADHPAVQDISPVISTDHVSAAKMYSKISSVCRVSSKNLTGAHFSSNNNAIPAQEIASITRAPSAITKSFKRSDISKICSQASSSPCTIFDETLNQTVLLNSLLDLERKTRISKRHLTPTQQSMTVNLARAQAEADAAYEASLVQTEWMGPSVEPSGVIHAPNTHEKGDEPVQIQDIHEESSLPTSHSADQQRSKIVEFNSSSERYGSDVINNGEIENRDFATKVYRKPGMIKTKPLKNIIKRGRVSFSPSCSVHKATSMFVLGAQKEIHASKGAIQLQHNILFQNCLKGVSKSTTNGLDVMNNKVVFSEIVEGRNKTVAVSDRGHFKKNRSIDQGFLPQQRNCFLSGQEDRCRTSHANSNLKFTERAALCTKTSANRGNYPCQQITNKIHRKDFRESIAMIEYANDTVEGWTCGSQELDKGAALNDQVAIDGTDTITLSRKNNDEEQSGSLDLKSNPTFQKDGPATATSNVSNCKGNPQESFDNPFESDSIVNKERDRIYETKNSVDSCQYYNEDAVNLDHGHGGEEKEVQPEKFINSNETQHSMGDECENIKLDTNCSLPGCQVYGNCRDPDYMSLSGYDVDDQDNVVHLEAQAQQVGQLNHCSELKPGFNNSMFSSETCLSLSTIEQVDSESCASSARISLCERSEGVCSNDIVSYIPRKSDSPVLSASGECYGEEALGSECALHRNDRQQRRFSTGSFGTSQQSKNMTGERLTNHGDVSVREVQPTSSVGRSPSSCELPEITNTSNRAEVTSNIFLDSAPISTFKDTYALNSHSELEGSHSLDAVQGSARREIVSGRPPPPTPCGHKLDLLYDGNCLTSHGLDGEASTLVRRREELLSGLNASVTSSFFVPVVIMNEWQEEDVFATVLKVYFCSEYSTRPQYRVDKDGYRLSKIAPLSVFYRQNSCGFPICLYTVQWYGRGLYSLKNRDAISDNVDLGLVKLGSLLDHSLQSGSQPPEYDHYPLLLLGSPTATKMEALKEAKKVRSTPTKKCQVSTLVNLFLGVTPWWTLPKHENRFLGPTRLSSCVTTKHYGAEENVCYNDQHLRDMMLADIDISCLVRTFQNTAIASFSNVYSAALASVDKTLRVRHKQNKRPKSEMFWSVSASGKATPISSFRINREETNSEMKRLPSISTYTLGEECGEFSSRYQNPNKRKPNAGNKSWKYPLDLLNESAGKDSSVTKLCVMGSRTSMARRCSLPPVGNATKQVNGIDGQQQKADNTSLEPNTQTSKLQSLASDTTLAKTVEAKGGKMRGWEWSDAVLPPPFPKTLRRSGTRTRVYHPIIRSVKGRWRIKTGTKKTQRPRSSNSSLKSYSSGPNTSSSSEDDSPSIKKLMINFSRSGQKHKTVHDVINMVIPGSNVSYRVKKCLEAKQQQREQEAKEEQRILDSGDAEDKTKTDPASARSVTDSPVMPHTPRTSRNGRVSAFSDYDMLSDLDEAKEVWANCFPEVHFSTKKKRWCQTKQTHKRRNPYAKAAVLLGLGSLI